MAERFQTRSTVDFKTGVLVVQSRSGPLLCPFFGRCDGVFVADHTGRAGTFHPFEGRNTASPCDIILELGLKRLICGYIPAADKAKLQRSEIDIRLGSCSTSIEHLVKCFCDLPVA